MQHTYSLPNAAEQSQIFTALDPRTYVGHNPFSPP